MGTWGDDEIVLLVMESSNSTPTIGLESQTVSGRVFIVVETSLAVTEIEFFVDDEDFLGEPAAVDREGPFEFELDTTTLANGDHTVSVLAHVDEGGVEETRYRHAQFSVKNSADTTRTSPTESTPGSFGEFSLRGDPSFDESQLSEEARTWYRRFLAAMENPDQKPNGNGEAHSGSLRDYGYTFQQYLMYLFTAVRATGDLGLVDEVARLSDIMASKLTTQWYDMDSKTWYDPTDGTAGHRRWLYLRAGHTHYRNGKDTDRISAYKAHATVALMAYMFELNRDVASPSGVDYGARADFWVDYLVNDFEVIWRHRENTPAGGDFFKYSDEVGASTLYSQLAYHYYMHKLTGDEARKAHAEREAATIAEAMYVTETPLGPAMIFSHRIRHHEEALSPIPYVRYVYPLQIDLALEGHPTFSDPEFMEMHARALAYFALDNGAVDLSFDIGGMEDRTGTNWLDGSTLATIRTKNPWDTSSLEWERITTWRVIDSYLTPIGAFGESERIGEVALDIYRNRESDIDNPRGLAVPLGMLLTEAMK